MKDILANSQKEDEHWISISDLMSGLMMVFLFIAIAFMLILEKDKERIEIERDESRAIKEQMNLIATDYLDLQDRLYEALFLEFKDDLDDWSAVIDKDSLAVRFEEPEVLFDQGESNIKELFESILDSFFPRYIALLSSEHFRSEISEIRIEGHTSSEWREGVSVEFAYIKNMELSQDRTRSVLEYVLDLDSIAENQDWVKSKLTANGLSSSKLLLSAGVEDRERSRRVEFRVRLNAEDKIIEILREGDTTK